MLSDPILAIRRTVDRSAPPEPYRLKVPQSGKPTKFELNEYLIEHEVPHHFEYFYAKWNEMVINPVRSIDPEPAQGYAVILHVYEENVAFELRLRFGTRVVEQDWKSLFTRTGSLRGPTST
jgi:hypothetical protein